MDQEQLIRATLDPDLRDGVDADQQTLRALLGAPTLGPVTEAPAVTAPDAITYAVMVRSRATDSEQLSHEVDLLRLPPVSHEGVWPSWHHDSERPGVIDAATRARAAGAEDRQGALLDLVRALTGK